MWSTSSWFLGLNPRCLLHQQSLKIDAVGKDIIANIVTPQTEMIKSHWILPLHSQFHCLQMCVHTDIHAYKKTIYSQNAKQQRQLSCAMHLCVHFQLNTMMHQQASENGLGRAAHLQQVQVLLLLQHSIAKIIIG